MQQPIPCPECGYDLQGQEIPRCPECGCQFESMMEMLEVSENAARVFVRVLHWRQIIACIFGIGIMFPGALAGLLVFLSDIFEIPYTKQFAIIFLILFCIFFSAGGLLSLILLIQVCLNCFDRRIPKIQRRELIGTIPLLLFYLIPFSLAVFVFVIVF